MEDGGGAAQESHAAQVAKLPRLVRAVAEEVTIIGQLITSPLTAFQDASARLDEIERRITVAVLASRACESVREKEVLGGCADMVAYVRAQLAEGVEAADAQQMLSAVVPDDSAAYAEADAQVTQLAQENLTRCDALLTRFRTKQE